MGWIKKAGEILCWFNLAHCILYAALKIVMEL